MEAQTMTADFTDKFYTLGNDITQIKTTVGFIQEQQRDMKDDMRGLLSKLDKLERQQSDFKATLAKYSVAFALVFSAIAAVVRHFLGV